MKDMEIIVNILKRLGQFTRKKEVKGQYRPLKIQVLQSLTKLKGLHIKITEDLTKVKWERPSIP